MDKRNGQEMLHALKTAIGKASVLRHARADDPELQTFWTALRALQRQCQGEMPLQQADGALEWAKEQSARFYVNFAYLVPRSQWLPNNLLGYSNSRYPSPTNLLQDVVTTLHDESSPSGDPGAAIAKVEAELTSMVETLLRDVYLIRQLSAAERIAIAAGGFTFNAAVSSIAGGVALLLTPKLVVTTSSGVTLLATGIALLVASGPAGLVLLKWLTFQPNRKGAQWQDEKHFCKEMFFQIKKLLAWARAMSVASRLKHAVGICAQQNVGKSTLVKAMTGAQVPYIGVSQHTIELNAYCHHNHYLVDTPGIAGDAGSNVSRGVQELVGMFSVVVYLVEAESGVTLDTIEGLKTLSNIPTLLGLNKAARVPQDERTTELKAWEQKVMEEGLAMVEVRLVDVKSAEPPIWNADQVSDWIQGKLATLAN